MQEAVAAVDFFLPSEIEARHLYGANAPEEAARAFTQLGPRAVVIKLGAGGSLVYDAVNHRVAHVPAYPAKACDPTGAGDSFCGGFLAGFLLTGDCVTAAQYGTVSASYTVEAVGALTTPQPLRADADARLQVVADRTACTARS